MGLPILRLQIIHPVIDKLPHLIIGLPAALLTVAAPAQALKVIDVSAGTALRHRLYVISLKEQIVTKTAAQTVEKVLGYAADLAGIIVPRKDLRLISRSYPSPSGNLPLHILLSSDIPPVPAEA